MSGWWVNACSSLARWPIVETAVAFVWLGSVWYAWRGVPTPTVPDAAEERNLGATVILAQLNGVITGCSIIIAGVGAFIALNTSGLGAAAPHVEWASIWAVLALGAALYALATLPTRTPTINFVRSKEVAILSATALLFALYAGARFMLAAVASIK
ncbi:hypothetical protein ACSBOB_29600 [Mesorhizobium sp. ASY16-5R]|uniref:hypothetical protein n=1 Tax=Mesorhizobium sp. ASY16-5R TaxID=3445772 RepID=UPI003FA11E84